MFEPALDPSRHDTPNANMRVTIAASDLPLHCPMPGKRLWDSHPRVYLPIIESGQQQCPYCGTVYSLARVTDTTS